MCTLDVSSRSAISGDLYPRILVFVTVSQRLTAGLDFPYSMRQHVVEIWINHEFNLNQLCRNKEAEGRVILTTTENRAS